MVGGVGKEGGGMEGVLCSPLGAAVGGCCVAEWMGGRTGTPSPGRLVVWPGWRLAMIVLALREGGRERGREGGRDGGRERGEFMNTQAYCMEMYRYT